MDPLVEASIYGDLAKVKYYIENESHNIDIINNAVKWASYEGHFEVVKYLVEHGADITSNDNIIISWIAPNASVKMAKYLIEHGADVNAQNGEALACACLNNRLDILKCLVDAGADIEAYGIRATSVTRQPRILKYLIEQGAKFDIDHPLFLAEIYNDKEMINYLVTHAKKLYELCCLQRRVKKIVPLIEKIKTLKQTANSLSIQVKDLRAQFYSYLYKK